jgi:diguanylate cyclase (GGDEF)-like protein
MPQVIDRFDEDPFYKKLFKCREELKSLLIMPVIHMDLEGVLFVAAKSAYSFPPKMQKIVSSFTDQMAWHIYNEGRRASLRGRSWPSIRQMNVFSRLIAESPDREVIADRLTRIPPSILKCDAVAVIWFNANGDVGKIQGHRGFTQELSGMNVIPGKGIVGSCARDRSPILTRIIDERKTILFSDQEKPESLKSLAAVPIVLNERLLGVLLCGSHKQDGLSQPDLDKLSLIASSAATSVANFKGKNRWDYDKNLDPITGVYNYRFLTNSHEAISKRIFLKSKPVYFLCIQLSNLPELYNKYGTGKVDRLLRQIASGFSRVIPAPKHLFKYSDNSFLLLIMGKSPAEAQSLETRLSNLFKNRSIYVDGEAMKVEAEWGMSSYPEEGSNLLDLASLSRSRTSQSEKAAPW